MLSFFLFFFAGVFKAFMDIAVFSWDTSIFAQIQNAWFKKWADARSSWKLKYKNENPREGEAFPGSSTIFVFVTDFWHFVQFCMLQCIFIGVIFYHPLVSFSNPTEPVIYMQMLDWIINFSIMRTSFALGFNLVWEGLRKMKKKKK